MEKENTTPTLMICNHAYNGVCDGINGDGDPCEGAVPHPFTDKCKGSCLAVYMDPATCIPYVEKTCPKYVLLKGVCENNSHNKFFTTNDPDKDPTISYKGDVWYEIVGYAETVKEAQEKLEKVKITYPVYDC